MALDQFLSLLKALVPTFTAAGSAIWIVYKYFEDRKEARRQQLAQANKENSTRMFEARKMFNVRQLELYTEVSRVAGRIVTTTNFDGPEWDTIILRFHQLYWTELSMVEDTIVKNAMIKFDEQLDAVIDAGKENDEARTEKMERLKQISYLLAGALKKSIESSWQVNLSKQVTPP